ncbi:MAG: signal recognition particle subunit SRP19/SEC65 family protein [Promethearchaeota archaeon]
MIYPCYFDVRRSRRMGRRLPRSICVQKPMLDELKVIAEHLKLVFEVEPEAKHPASWWDDHNGRLLISKEDREGNKIIKAKIVRKFGKYLQAVKKKKKEKEKTKVKHSRQAYKKQASHKKYIKKRERRK